jgi:prepilin-type N-terminal cleavage/methylation domain-containing protein
MLKKFFSGHKNQKGFTLIELLVAVAITAVIGSVLTMSIFQLFSINAADKNRMEAVKQVENALHYINRDIQMAATIIPGGESAPYLFSDRLTLKWTDYTGSSPVPNEVTYTLDADGNLSRNHKYDVEDYTIIIARHIDPASYYTLEAGMYKFYVKSSVGGYKPVSEERTLYVKPRIN